MENKCSQVDLHFLIQWKVPVQVGPWSGCPPVYPLQPLLPHPPWERCLGAEVPRFLVFPRFLGLLASTWFPSGWRLDSKEKEKVILSFFLAFGGFSISKSFQLLPLGTGPGPQQHKFSHLPQQRGWWLPAVDNLRDPCLVPQFLRHLCGQFPTSHSFFFFFFLN